MRHATFKSTTPTFPSTLTTLISYQLFSTLPPKQASVTNAPGITPASAINPSTHHQLIISPSTAHQQQDLVASTAVPMAPWPHGPATGACGRAPVPLHVSCSAVGRWMLSMLGLPRSAGAVSCGKSPEGGEFRKKSYID